MSRLCETCGERPSQWFTDDGYLCTPCTDALRLVKRQNAQSLLIEQMRKALMVAHADDWDMDAVADAAYICAQVALPIPEEPTDA